ncbi:MAG: alpha/beta hydrolase [Rubrivivax sp.]
MKRGPQSNPSEAPDTSGSSDLRGAARLATEATAGLTDLVEAMHERIARLPGFATPVELGRAGRTGRTTGITGLVYRSIRGVTRVVGGSADALLSLLAPVLDSNADRPSAAAVPRPQRDAIVAALNGVMGDHLQASGNPLAIQMALRRNGRRLTLQRDALKAALPDASGSLLVMVHGLCMNDLQWSKDSQHQGSHATRLSQELGLTPLHLHYNTGLHVSDNGRNLSLLLEQLLAEWPQPVQRLTLLCHSMGGLVARSALAQAQAAGLGWTARLADLVFLGTPHHGAPLERAGNGLSIVLSDTPYFGSYTAPIGRLTKLRSAGITDLRHGHLLEADRAGDRFAKGPDARQPVPLPAQINCYAVAGHLGQDATASKARLLGDGLVPLDSALGRHADPARTLAFAPDRTWVAQGVGHVGLLHRTEVTEQLLHWLR